MMVRVASGHFAGNVNLGGIAEVYNAFVPCIWGRGVFRIPNEPGFSSKHAANSREPGNTECSQALPGGGRTNDTFLQTAVSGKADCHICHLN